MPEIFHVEIPAVRMRGGEARCAAVLGDETVDRRFPWVHAGTQPVTTGHHRGSYWQPHLASGALAVTGAAGACRT